MMLQEFARAKVNLTLHVTGQRPDGYHLLDSLVVFASCGDKLQFTPSQSLSLSLDGPEAPALVGEDNSILAAAASLDATKGADIRLSKHLPVSSGIGGGSADAAAALRGLSALWGLPKLRYSAEFCAQAARLGADVPVCVFSKTTRMSGIGEQLEFLTGIPALHAVLVNPRVEVSTPAVFGAITDKTNLPMAKLPARWEDQASFVAWLGEQRNDMQKAAEMLVPAISEALDALSTSPTCQLARMSGSGATCFGIYPSEEDASAAASGISDAQPNWWVQPCTLGA